ncbi:Protein FAM170A [Vulpes lagopus]
MNDAIICSIHCISEAFISFPGVSKSQADAPQVESTEEAKGWDAGVEEVSSASEYFSCVSSPLKLTHSGTPPSDVSTRNLLSDSEPSGEEQEHEERAESDSPPGSPAVEEGPRAKTPDWLVTVETGFRCMACCRVFSTLESLQEHVQHGVREGFSCHVFHLTMARLGGSRRAGSAQEEEGERSEAPAARPEGKASEEEPATREDLGST